MLGVLLLESVLDRLQHIDRGVGTVNAEVQLGPLGAPLRPPEPVEGGDRADAVRDVTARFGGAPLRSGAVAEGDAVLEDLKLQGDGVDDRVDLDVHDGVPLTRERCPRSGRG